MKCRIEFDERRILVAVQRGGNAALRRAGAYIRKAALRRRREAVLRQDQVQLP